MTHEKDPPRFIVFVGGYVFKDGKLLLAQRSYDEGHLPGYWAVPGGKVDIPDEITYSLLEKTIAREIDEEVGIEISDTMTLLLNNNFVRTDGQNVIAINFACEYKSGTPKPLDGTIDVKWVSQAELKDLKIEPTVLKQINLAFDTYNSK